MTETRDDPLGSAPDTVADALRLLEGAGYAGEFSSRRGHVHCNVCGDGWAPIAGVVEAIYRFEGPSDPDEEAMVLALHCARCGAKGVLVSGYGPSADPEDIDVIVALTDGRPSTRG
jgi:hypothetical protein